MKHESSKEITMSIPANPNDPDIKEALKLIGVDIDKNHILAVNIVIKPDNAITVVIEQYIERDSFIEFINVVSSLPHKEKAES